MSKYNFDEVINRYNTNSLKYDYKERRGMPSDVLPLWVADMDFKTAPEIIDALVEKSKHGIFGYSEPLDGYYNALNNWATKHWGWTPTNNKIILVSKDETEDVKFEITDISEVEDGTLVKMYLTAVLGYEIENIEIVDADENQIDYTETDTNEYTFIMPDSDVTITPNYRAIMNSEEDKEKEDDKDEGIVETIKTEVTNLYERINNPSTGDKAFELAFAGVAGIIVLLIVKAKRRKSSTRKSNILY